MKRVILHIGIPKTGSTALQLFFVRNRALYESRGIGYFQPEFRFTPWDTSSNGHFLVADALYKLGDPKDPERKMLLEKDPSLDIFRLRLDQEKKKQLDRVKQSFNEYAKDHDTLILSEEIFWHYDYFYDDYWQIIRDEMIQLVGECFIDILIYLRRQDRWILSKWKEDMRNELPSPLDFFETLDHYEKIGYLDYKQSLERLERAFGREHLIVRDFERDSFTDGTIISDLLAVFPELMFDDLDLIANGTVNRSISIKAALAMSLINKKEVEIVRRDSRFYFGSDLFTTVSAKEPANAHVMSADEIRSLLDRYKESNRMIADRYHGGKALFDETVKDATVIKPDIRRDRRNAFIISMFVRYEKPLCFLSRIKQILKGNR